MRLSFAKLVVASAEKDYFALLEAFDEMGLKLNRLDSEADMDAMRFLFRDTSPPTEARAQLRKFDKAMKNKAKARREKKIGMRFDLEIINKEKIHAAGGAKQRKGTRKK